MFTHASAETTITQEGSDSIRAEVPDAQDVNFLIKDILKSFLISMSEGSTADQFIANDPRVAAFREEIISNSRALLETQSREASVQASSTVAIGEVTGLLKLAMELLEPSSERGNQPDDTTTLQTEALGDNDGDNDSAPSEQQANGDVELNTELSLDDEDLDMDAFVSDTDVPLSSLSEALSEAVSSGLNAETTSAYIAEFAKNPEISDTNFVNATDEPINTFIFVKYSHLDYHYELDGDRYKLVLSDNRIQPRLV